jgi:hypothetical protein
MMRRARWSLGLVVAIVLTSAGPASANGYCGPDPTGATACPVSSNSTLSGSIVSSSERDYYVFYVAHQTDLQVTITDEEDARCSTSDPSYPYFCGWAEALLLDSHGNQLGDTFLSFPDNGVARSKTITKTVGRGIYYVQVSGDVDAHTPPSIPYQLTVNGNPGVQWPPACIVPRVGSKMTLARAKHVIGNNRCTVGAVHRMRSSKPRGDVLRFHPGAGSILPYGAKVAIWVSGQPRHHRRRHHK